MAESEWSLQQLLRIGTPARLAAATAVLAVFSAVGLPSSPAPAAGLLRTDAPLVVEAADPSVDVDDPELVAEMAAIHANFDAGPTRSLPPLTGALTDPMAAVGGGVTVTFDATKTAPSNVQTVVLAAVANWDAALATNPSGPVNVAVIWENLGNSGLLGSAGPSGLYASPSLPTSSYYPAALANTLLGTDLNGSTPELMVNLNSIANWYVGTGTPPSGKIDLYSVVLHELAHGLGFLGSASSSNSPPNPSLDTPPFVYDRLVTYNGGPLLSASSPNSLLRSNSLYVDLSASFEAKLYAPSTWQEGSSYSHFDESSYPAGWPGALMTPSLGAQQVERDLDGPTLGVMAGLGWPMDAQAITPAITGTSTTSGSVTVNWGLDLGSSGVAPDGFRVEAWRNGTALDGSVAVSGGTGAATVSGLMGGADYTVKVVPHAHAIDGVPATTNVVISGTPTAPTMVAPSGSGLNRTVSWAAPSGAGITGYTVQRSTDGQDWFSVGTTGSTSLVATVPAGIHQFRVRANNNFGPGAWGYSIPTGISSGVVRPVALDGQIARLYRAYFRRDPDASGFYFWQSQRAAGTSLAGVSNAFAASAEFQSTYGSLGNDAFVELVYANVLGRVADSGGKAYWMSRLSAGVSRGQVMTGFSESAELVATTGTVAPTSAAEAAVYRLYLAFFLRFPDQAGHQYWVGVRNGGASLESIAAAFATSAEFVQTYGSLVEASFVNLVYANVLARIPDTTGASYWQSQLNTGVNRGSMMVGFSESPEFVIATGTVP
jgi:Domain of unknown function (DUF4214)